MAAHTGLYHATRNAPPSFIKFIFRCIEQIDRRLCAAGLSLENVRHGAHISHSGPASASRTADHGPVGRLRLRRCPLRNFRYSVPGACHCSCRISSGVSFRVYPGTRRASGVLTALPGRGSVLPGSPGARCSGFCYDVAALAVRDLREIRGCRLRGRTWRGIDEHEGIASG